MVRRPPRSTRTDTLVPYTTLCRSADGAQCGRQILAGGATCEFDATLQIFAPHLQFGALRCCVMALRAAATRIPELPAQYQRYGVEVRIRIEIGRAPCRERVCKCVYISVVAV